MADQKLPFRLVKLQFLLDLVLDRELDDTAFRVAAYLSLVHADHENGVCFPSFEKIAAALGRHPRSVRRALRKPALASYLTIEPGKHRGRSSRYRPTDEALDRAAIRRREGEKNGPVPRAKGGQSRAFDVTLLSLKGGQGCPPNLRGELRSRTAAAAPDLPEDGLSGTASDHSAASPGLVFVPRDICFARDWNDRLAQVGMDRLDRCLPLASHEGRRGFWVPARSPAPRGSLEWQRQLRQLRALVAEEAAARKEQADAD